MREGTIVGGRYAVIRLLGEGGMGAVYEASHTTTGRRVALKVIARELAGKPDVVARFEREARAAGAIESEHVAQVLDVDHDDALGVPFLVMEYLEGRDLEQVLEEVRALPWEVALRIGREACLGLAKAHEQGILHRDIKPANLFLCDRDRGLVRVKLVDFGIAKLLGSPSETPHKLTRTGTLIGSPLYMAPEQARAARELGPAVDIWSLGVVLYQALVGETPIASSESIGELIIRLCTEPPPPIRGRAPWVPEPVAAAVERALQLKPEDRYASAKSMGDALATLIPDSPLRKDQLVAGARPAPAPDVGAAVDGTAVEAAVPQGNAPTRAVAPATIPGAPLEDVAKVTAVVPTHKTPEPQVVPTERIPRAIEVLPAAQPTTSAPVVIEPEPQRRWVGPTKVSGAPEPTGPATEKLAPAEAKTNATSAPRSSGSKALFGVGAVALIGLASGGLYWRQSATDREPVPIALPTASGSPSTARAGSSEGITSSTQSAAPSAPSALAALAGRYTSEKGVHFDAVLRDDALELRVVDPKELPHAGYAAGEPRFVLRAKPGSDGELLIEDHVRPLLLNTKLGEVSPPSCLLVVSEIDGRPLVAKIDASGPKRKLVLQAVRAAFSEKNLRMNGATLTGCADLASAQRSLATTTFVAD